LNADPTGSETLVKSNYWHIMGRENPSFSERKGEGIGFWTDS
jgi:hypothetical protein